jgi:hypothetical protein
MSKLKKVYFGQDTLMKKKPSDPDIVIEVAGGLVTDVTSRNNNLPKDFCISIKDYDVESDSSKFEETRYYPQK